MIADAPESHVHTWLHCSGSALQEEEWLLYQMLSPWQGQNIPATNPVPKTMASEQKMR